MKIILFFSQLSLVTAFSILQIFDLPYYPIKTAHAESNSQASRPFAVFVDGNGDCCAWQMEEVQDELRKLHAEIWRTSYTHFRAGSSQQNLPGLAMSNGSDATFLIEAQEVLNKIDPSRPIILIGHDLGAKSLLKLLPLINRKIELIALLAPPPDKDVQTLTSLGVDQHIGTFLNYFQIDNARNSHGGVNQEIKNCNASLECSYKEFDINAQNLPATAWIQEDINQKLDLILTQFTAANTQTESTQLKADICDQGIVLQANDRDLKFEVGTRWETCNGYLLTFQNDGNLVLYNPKKAAIWSSKTDTPDNPADTLAMQTDGNVVLYRKGIAVWTTGTNSPRSILKIQKDGNVVIYNQQSQPIWATNTQGL